MAWLIAYDVASARRWRRIHRLLRERATKLQYSLFWFDGDRKAIEVLAAQLGTLIHPSQDDVRIYALPRDARVELLGARPWASGVDGPAQKRFEKTLHDPALPILTR